MPRRFFDDHVKPNYAEWLKNPLDQRLAKNAVADANNMAARVLQYWLARDAWQVYGVTTERAYRDELAARECPDFGLVRDVADAHKHFRLDRSSRQVTGTDQTAIGAIPFGGGGYGEGVYGGGPQLVVTQDDGTQRALTAIMKNVMEMWARLLGRWNL